MITSRLWHRAALALVAVLALGVGASALPAGAAGAYGPDTCLYGYVWRDGRSGDHVCVTVATRTQTAADNAAGPSHRNPAGGAYGPDTCFAGYVWREAWSGDHVCVTPARRTQVANDNAAGPSHRALDSYAFTWAPINLNSASGDVGAGTLTLEMNPNGAYSFTGHLHNYSVIVGYNLSVACVVTGLDGTNLSFSATGSVGSDSFLTSGSPDWNWNLNGTSAQVVNHWSAIPRNIAGSTHCTATSSWNVASLISSLKMAYSIIGPIVAIAS